MTDEAKGPRVTFRRDPDSDGKRDPVYLLDFDNSDVVAYDSKAEATREPNAKDRKGGKGSGLIVVEHQTPAGPIRMKVMRRAYGPRGLDGVTFRVPLAEIIESRTVASEAGGGGSAPTMTVADAKELGDPDILAAALAESLPHTFATKSGAPNKAARDKAADMLDD